MPVVKGSVDERCVSVLRDSGANTVLPRLNVVLAYWDGISEIINALQTCSRSLASPPSTSHINRMIRILRSEQRRQSSVGANQALFRDWAAQARSLTEFLWLHTLSSLPKRKKVDTAGGKVLELGDAELGKREKSVLQLGPKFCTGTSMRNTERLALARTVTRCAPEKQNNQVRVGRTAAALAGC
ncbi:hypothetical protein HPB52_023085 [Rhipicephalus sanguineus]|uniref:Uncharacterized protein n=1 Tax=Rhipicephalus sanguineus TaxID=34632 RepID=A0A9D4Q8Z8_RHISA|nr:hypothetical protein HPB52_023085 [Rhipicephalus sanguineus]